MIYRVFIITEFVHSGVIYSVNPPLVEIDQEDNVYRYRYVYKLEDYNMKRKKIWADVYWREGIIVNEKAGIY